MQCSGSGTRKIWGRGKLESQSATSSRSPALGQMEKRKEKKGKKKRKKKRKKNKGWKKKKRKGKKEKRKRKKRGSHKQQGRTKLVALREQVVGGSLEGRGATSEESAPTRLLGAKEADRGRRIPGPGGAA